MVERYNRTERARQFMPFAALKGYEALLREQESVEIPKRMPSEEKSLWLSRRLQLAHRGKRVEAVYYSRGIYNKIIAEVKEVDYIFKTITIGNCKILFSDIFDFRLL